MSDIQTIGLTKRFRDFWGHSRVLAVDHLDLEIQRGEIFGLLGPNGSGKSTTIKMLLGLLFPSSGIAKILGKPPGDVKVNRYIGYLPEESYLYPFLTARETLDFYGRLFGIEPGVRKKRMDSLLEMVGLGGAARRRVGEFSKGMQRRIGLAQALINDPDLLILDEPTSGMDPLGTRQIKDLIIELGHRGKTVLLCSHLLADVEDVCDRIGILYGGKLRHIGTMDELLARRDMTEIRTRQLSEEQLSQVRAVLGDDNVEISTPRQRLEEFFLQIVEQAQRDQVQTSGALIGGTVSDFLGQRPAESPADLIDKLVGVRDSKAPVPSSESIPTTPLDTEESVQKDVLDDLVAPRGSVESIAIEPDDVHLPPADNEQVDEGLIDDLLGRDKNKPENP